MNVTVAANPCFREPDLSEKRYVVMCGSAGSGKSYGTAQHYILRLTRDAGRNLVAMRKCDSANRDSTFAELTLAVKRIFGEEAEKYWEIGLAPLSLRCRANGNRIIFRGMSDARARERLKSVTFERGKLTDVWLEEATEFSREDLEIIDDRLRGRLPAGLFYQIRLTFNPVSANHWIKRTFFDAPDPNVLCHRSTYRDNRFIDEAFVARMERRRLLDPEGYRIYGLGEWGESGGLIFGNWETREISASAADYDDVALGQDFGFNHANAILLLGSRDGDVYVLDELVVTGRSNSEIIALAEKRHLPKNKPMWCDSAEPDRIKEWRRAGFRARGVDKGGSRGSVRAQIDWLRGRRIYISPRCGHTLREISQWRWRYDARAGEFTEEPTPIFDDAMAALRYGVEGWRRGRAWLI